jgi:hypothetical protein
MRKLLWSAVGALLASAAVATAANAAPSFGVTYFEVPSNFGGDFGICCSSPPATGAHINIGDALGPDGLPVTHNAGDGFDVVDQDAAHQVLWWSAGNGVVATGTGTLPLPLPLQDMFAPNSTGGNNSAFFETAILHGVFTGSGAPAQLTVQSDDDAFVYLDGLYIGGNPGVHGTTTAVLNLGSLTGNHTLDVFYADRAQVDAKLGLTGINLDTLRGTPEPASWALMIMGFGAAGAMLRRARQLAAA